MQKLGGSVTVQVEGFSPKLFISKCNGSGIWLYDVKSISERKISARMSADDFFKLRPIARQSHCKVTITSKEGFSFKCRFLRRRPMLVLGFLLFIGALWYGSELIWKIEVEGNDKLPQEQVRELINQSGASVMMRRSDLDMGALETAIELASPQIAWAGARRNGGVLTISIIESERFAVEEMELPCDIVAAKDAVVVEITTLNGVEMVVPKQTVKAGEVLISGMLPAHENAPVRYVTAKGNVTGSVWYIGRSLVERTHTATARTGKFEYVKIIQFADQRWDMGGSYRNYEVAEETKIGIDDMFIPVSVITQKRCELGETSVTLSDEELRAEAAKQARQSAYDLLDKNAVIVDENENVVLKSDSAYAQFVVQTLENIGCAKMPGELP